MSTAKAKSFRNVGYTAVTKGTTLVCIAVTSSVVARNLSPADYGVIGFATIIIDFLFHFSDVGVISAAVRRPDMDSSSLRTAFTLKLILGFVAFGAAWMVAPFARHLFDHPATANVVRVLALNFLVNTVGFMPVVMLTREQNYRALVIPGVTNAVARSILAITLILCGWKYWAVILADVGANLASGVATHFVRRIRVALNFDWRDAWEYLRFGIPLLGAGLLTVLIFNLDNFLVGSRLGSAQLGYYALAFGWGSFICGLLSSTVENALFPAFSAIQGDIAAMRRWYLKTIDLVGFVSVVANTALLANAHFVLVTVLAKGSDKWLPAEAALKILCLYGIARSVTQSLGNCIMALGKTNALLHANGVAGAVEVCLLLLVLRTGRIDLVACAVLVAYVSQGFVYLPFLRRNLGVSGLDIVGRLWPIIPAVVAGYVCTSILPSSFGGTLFAVAVRGLFTAVVVAVVHGCCTRFRCFQEAGGMLWQNLARARA